MLLTLLTTSNEFSLTEWQNILFFRNAFFIILYFLAFEAPEDKDSKNSWLNILISAPKITLGVQILNMLEKLCGS